MFLYGLWEMTAVFHAKQGEAASTPALEIMLPAKSYSHQHN